MLRKSLRLHQLNFHLNGKHLIKEGHLLESGSTLLDFLRVRCGLTGTKRVCSEGGCGACTVLLTERDPDGGGFRHRSVASCLLPSGFVQGAHVLTVESAGLLPAGRRVQAALEVAGASQCGFCSPGAVMSLLGCCLASSGRPSLAALVRSLDGTLCRCTGYRPFLDACRQLESDGRAGRLDGDFAVLGGELLQGGGGGVAAAPGWTRPASLAESCRLLAASDTAAVSGSHSFPYESALVGGNTDLLFAPRPVPRRLVSLRDVAELREVSLEAPEGVWVGAARTIAELDALADALRARGGRTLAAALRRVTGTFANQQVRSMGTIGGSLCNGSHLSDLVPLAVAADFEVELAHWAPGAEEVRRRRLPYEALLAEGGPGPQEVMTRVLLPLPRPDADDLRRLLSFKVGHRRRLDAQAHVNGALALTLAADEARTIDDARLCFGGLGVPGLRARGTEAALRGLPLSSPATLGVALAALDAEAEELVARSRHPTPEARRYQRLLMREAVSALLRGKNSLYQTDGAGDDDDDGDETLRPFFRDELVAEAKAEAVRGTFRAREDPHFPALPHTNARTQLTGRAVYPSDSVVPPGGYYAALVTAPCVGALRGVDSAEFAARARDGGHDWHLLTAADCRENHMPNFRPGDWDEVLADAELRYVGQPVAVVLAPTEREAREAAALVRVDATAAPPEELVLKPAQVRRHYAGDGAAPIYSTASAHPQHDFVAPSADAGGEGEGWRVIARGDLDALRRDAACVEGEIDLTHGQYPFYLETQSAFVVPGGGDGDGAAFRVLSSSQAPSTVSRQVALCLGLPEHTVACETPRIGGGFGGKQTRAGLVACLAAIGAQRTGRPVLLRLPRDQDMAFCPGRLPVTARFRAYYEPASPASSASSSSSGETRLLGLEMDIEADGGSSQDYSQDVLEVILFVLDGGYRLPDVLRLRGRCGPSHKGSYTATRGFGKPQAQALIEEVLDRVAGAAGACPQALRSSMVYRAGDETPTGAKVGDNALERCFALATGDGDELRRLQRHCREFNARHADVKRGVCAVPSKGNMGFVDSPDVNFGGAKVVLLTDGSVFVTHSGVEMGQGLSSRLAAITACELGVPRQLVRVGETETLQIPNSPPTTMVSTDMAGESVQIACAQLRDRLRPYLPSDAPDVVTPDAVLRAHQDGVDLAATGKVSYPRLQFDFEKQQGDMSYFFVWGAAMALVELHVPTGAWKVLRADVVQDTGRTSLNSALDRGQVEGGFAMGLGYYMLEHMLYDPNSAALFSNSVSRYKIPSHYEMPSEFNVRLLDYENDGVDSTLKNGVYGTKGIGEANVGLALSCAYALKDAVRQARKDKNLPADFALPFPTSPERLKLLID